MRSNRHRPLDQAGSSPVVAALVERTVELAFKRLRVARHATPETVEQVIDVVSSGAFDEAIAEQAPPVAECRVKRRFDEQKEFSRAAWKKRRGSGA